MTYTGILMIKLNDFEMGNIFNQLFQCNVHIAYQLTKISKVVIPYMFCFCFLLKFNFLNSMDFCVYIFVLKSLWCILCEF